MPNPVLSRKPNVPEADVDKNVAAPKPPDSKPLNKFQQARRICLKRKHQKTGTFGEAPESGLVTGDRIINFNNLQIDHLPKQQVVGCEKPRRSTLPRITMSKREEL